MGVILKFLGRNFAAGSAFICTLFLAYFEGFYDWENPRFALILGGVRYGLTNKDGTFLFFAGLIIVFSVIEVIRREVQQCKNDRMRKDNERLQAESDEMVQRLMSYFNPIVRDFLQQLYDELEYDEYERITAYKVEDDCFWPIGRVSENHEFRAFRRRRYPKDQGCIGSAWREKEAHDNRVPEELDRWCERQENKWGIPKDEAKSIRMKSRSIFAIRVDRESDGKEALVVLVFESMLAQKLSLRNCRKIKGILDNYALQLERMFCDYHEYGPSRKTTDRGY